MMKTTFFVFLMVLMTLCGTSAQEVTRQILAQIKHDVTIDEAITAVAEERAVSAQEAFEARLVHALRTSSFSTFGELLPTLKTLRPDYDLQNSILVESTQGLDAVEALLSARFALDQGDHEGFEAQVKEAYFLDPNLHPLLSQWIEEFRTLSQ